MSDDLVTHCRDILLDGLGAMTPGIHDMPAEQYHADPCPMPSLSNSIAQILISRSPMHAWMAHPKLNQNFQPDESSRMDLGSAAHAILLENDWAIVEEVVADDWRTKAAREKRDEIRARGKYPVLSKHYAALRQMVPVAHMCIEASELAGIFDEGEAERTLCWRESGVWMRCRMDWRSTDGLVVLDYKTCQCAEPEAFSRQIINMGYDMQAAFYLRGHRATGGSPHAKFVFLAQEIEPPYACSLVGVAPSLMALGDMKVERAVQLWRRCIETNNWPAYPARIAWAEVPEWAERRWMDREQAMDIEEQA